MTFETSFRCFNCYDFVRAEFKQAGSAYPDYWYGYCPNCGERNILRKPSWSKKALKEVTQ